MIRSSHSSRSKVSRLGLWRQNKPSVKVVAFTAITLSVIILRLYVSFSHHLILGMDGGYYPVQVRNILKTGLLSFNDVPLYFYFCASIVKIISIFIAINDQTIINIIKIVDSTALPLLAIPLFRIMTRNDQKFPLFAGIAILFFALFSFSPFIMLGDLQKNAFAIPVFITFIYFLEEYLTTPSKRNLIVALLVLFVLALTHFGTFTFGLAFLTISFVVAYGRKAILPSLITISMGCLIVALFDLNRAYRVLTFWNVIFARQLEFQGQNILPILVNTIISYGLAIFGILQYRKQKHKTDQVTGTIALSLAVLILIFAFPLFDHQYAQRFHALLFVPQSLLIFNLIRMNNKLALPFSISLALLTLAFSLLYFNEEKKPCIDQLAYRDLQNIGAHIPTDRAETIILARHGLEFWTAWNLNMKVANDRSTDKLGLEKYKHIIFLQQKNEERHGPMGRRPMHKPEDGDGGHPPMDPGMDSPFGRPIPGNSKLIYSSPYFNAYQKLN